MPKRKARLPQEIILDSPVKMDRLTPTGQAIGTLSSGKKIFLWNALPGEIITKYQPTKSKSSFEEGIALEIKKQSENRIEPKDAQFLSTSPWQIISEDFEKTAKVDIIKELFRNILANCQIDNIAFHDSKIYYNYRNKMEYALYYDHDTNKIFPAVHSRGTHHKIPITSSSIERPEIWQEANKIINKLNEERREARDFQSLLLRCDQNGKVSGGLYENYRPHPVFNNLEDTLLGYSYSYSPNGFFQINLPVYEEALKTIKSLIIDDTPNILDLYSGVGTIGLSVARDKNLTLVEVDKSAYRELENNCKKIKNSNIRPVLAKSEEVLDYITPDSVVILDPPRAGCDDKLIQKLIEVHPKEIIYLSCNPATQVRDLEKLLASNFKLNSIDIFNFFPRTPHIENLVSLK